MTYQLHHGDCLDILKTLENNSIDAIVTDPPYGLSFMGKKWDYGVPSVEIWQQALRVLKPGGHLLSFGGTRTYHRLAVNIEDAGFEIRDQIQWIYGQGFPKSMDVSKAIDKSLGAEREVIGKADYTVNDKRNGAYASEEATQRERLDVLLTKPASDQAKKWEGWGTALKPANEPICLARKPPEGTIANNVQTYGTGTLNIDGCRVPYTGDTDPRTFNGQWRTDKAAILENFHFIGIEREADYIDIARKRIEQAMQETPLLTSIR